jgi:membrane-associated protease RseP (regulator of RpoE activity)
MIHWKKLAVGLIMAGAANPALVSARADDKPGVESKEDASNDDDGDDAKGQDEEHSVLLKGGQIIIVTPDGKQQKIELGPQLKAWPKPSPLIRYLSAAREQQEQPAPPKFVIGVGVSETPPVVWAQLKRDGGSGVTVATVMDDTPAKAAGVQENDIILKANGKSIADQKALTDVVQEAADKPVELLILRAGEELTIAVTPKENKAATFEWKGQVFSGQELPPQLLEYGVHSFGPGVILQNDPTRTGKLEREIEQLRAQVDEINRKLDELKK